MKIMNFKTVCHAVTIAFSLLYCQFCNAYIVSKTTSPNPKLTSNTVAEDMTNIGSLTVPAVGIGTISWSSNSLFDNENEELDEVVSMAYRSNAAFFDTAERYGTHWKTAFGMGYGETERMTSKYIQKAKLTETPSDNPVLLTKFLPTPWRRDVQSVVDACEQSCRNLGVDQIDLYQIHMPDGKFQLK